MILSFKKMNNKIDENKCYKIKLKTIMNKNEDREKYLNQINRWLKLIF